MSFCGDVVEHTEGSSPRFFLFSERKQGDGEGFWSAWIRTFALDVVVTYQTEDR